MDIRRLEHGSITGGTGVTFVNLEPAPFNIDKESELAYSPISADEIYTHIMAGEIVMLKVQLDLGLMLCQPYVFAKNEQTGKMEIVVTTSFGTAKLSDYTLYLESLN